MYKRIILKLSGEALSGKGGSLDQEKLTSLAKQIKQIQEMGVQVGVVTGGGNFVRGRQLVKLGMDRNSSDFMGMLGTVMNALALQSVLRNEGVKALAMSAIGVDGVTRFERDIALDRLENGYVLVFGGGIANPYFSTDSGAALRACQLHADVILIAKNGVDGVYDSDPAVNPDATRYSELSFDDILDLNLGIIDATAAGLCRENKIDALIFNMNEEGNIVKAAQGTVYGTVIHGGK